MNTLPPETDPGSPPQAWRWALGRQLHGAVRDNDTGELRRLLLRGAEVEAPDARGRTALHAAAEEGRERALVLLLAHGADPTRRDPRGLTPLDAARLSWHLPLVDRMREHLADLATPRRIGA